MNFGSINKHPIWGLFLAIGLGFVSASIFIWPSGYGGGIEVGIAIFFAVIAAFIFFNSILGFRRLRRGMTDGDVPMSGSGFWKGFFSAIALVFLWFIVVVPQYADYASQAQSVEILGLLGRTKDRVEEQIRKTGTLNGSGAGLKIQEWGQSDHLLDHRDPINFRHVSSDGVIIIRGVREGQVMVLVPSLQSGVVTWECVGGSADAVPSACR